MNAAMSRLLRELITHHRVAALGTLQDGAPYVSLVPFALAADGRGLIIHVSQLAAHTQNMVRERDVSVLVAEPDGPDKLPQGLARVTIEGIAHLLEPVDPDYSAAPRHTKRDSPTPPVCSSSATSACSRLKSPRHGWWVVSPKP